MEGLQLALIRHIGAAGSDNTVGSLLIARNSLLQFGSIEGFLTLLMVSDPFLAHICGPARCRPLAAIYVFADRKRKKTAVAMPVRPVPNGCGVQAFE